MATDPNLPASDEAVPEDQTTPGGQVDDLERLADETGAEVAPDSESG